MFKWNNPGCPCCEPPCTGTLRVTATGPCVGKPLSAATVTIFEAGTLGGDVAATGTTDASGQASFTLPHGTYAVRIERARVTTNNSQVSGIYQHPVVYCGQTTDYGASMGPASGYNCCTDCATPRSNTQYLTIGSTTKALMLDNGGTPTTFATSVACDHGENLPTTNVSYWLVCPSVSASGQLELWGSVPVQLWRNVITGACEVIYGNCVPPADSLKIDDGFYLFTVTGDEDCDVTGGNITFTVPTSWDLVSIGTGTCSSVTYPSAMPYSGSAVVSE